MFYVYEHWRPDKGVCFYVGKGHGNRSNIFADRNPFHRNVRAKLSRLGMCIEVRMVHCELDEETAFAIERERIAFWRSLGIKLTNLTDGGEGPSGFVPSEETRSRLRDKRRLRVFTEADRAAISAGRKGMKFSEEHKASLTARKLGRKRKPFTDETIRKMRLASTTRENAKRALYGTKVRRTSVIKGFD